MLEATIMYYIICDRCRFHEPTAEAEDSEYNARKAFGWHPDSKGKDVCTLCRSKEPTD